MPKSKPNRKGRIYQKKLQRKRRRQKTAQERDKKAAEVEAALQTDPEYTAWQQEQTAFEELQNLADERRRADEEEQWLRRELLAQREFRLEQQRHAAEEARQAAIREQQHKELEERAAAERKRREEEAARAAAAAAEFERTMERLHAYLEDSTATEPPAELRCWRDTHPGQKICEFFERTNCCRFGFNCQYNHRLPLLSSILLIKHFYIHPLLRHSTHNEYMEADAMLELDERDIRADYDAFFEDVVPELEQFGTILNFRTVCNTWKHLSGNVFVEYVDERSALKAFIKLQGRFYATRRLNVEFAGLHTWRSAICVFFCFSICKGLSVNRKCPKGQTCNYLHLFRNPENKYNILPEHTKPATVFIQRIPNTSNRNECNTPLLSWNDIERMENKRASKQRDWRWSASPELEMPQTSQDERTKHKERHEREKPRTHTNNGKHRAGSKDKMASGRHKKHRSSN